VAVPIACGQNLSFVNNLFGRPKLLQRGQDISVGNLLQCNNSISIQTPAALRELITVSAGLGDQILIQEDNGIPTGYPEPKLIILTDRKRFIEGLFLIEKATPQ
jgi:hypothetical protein